MQARIAAIPRAVSARVVGATLLVPTSTVLGFAAWLTPDPRGFGTHTQLGLGQCTFLHLTGYPCPMCGMTTTFALMAHAHPVEAALNQPFGVVLFSLTVASSLVGGLDVATGSGFTARAWAGIQRREQRLAIALLAGMMLGWVYKILLMHPELRP